MHKPLIPAPTMTQSVDSVEPAAVGADIVGVADEKAEIGVDFLGKGEFEEVRVLLGTNLNWRGDENDRVLAAPTDNAIPATSLSLSL